MAATNPILAATLQAALLGAFSNILAQLITSDKTTWTVDWVPVNQFLLFGIISTPPNFLWQDFLETTFPAHPRSKSAPGKNRATAPARLSARNTITKFILDQTVGAAINTLLFSVFMHTMHDALSFTSGATDSSQAAALGSSAPTLDFSQVKISAVWARTLEEFWPIMKAGWKFWPSVSLVNYTMVKTVKRRNLVGALAGMAWGMYMSLVAAR